MIKAKEKKKNKEEGEGLSSVGGAVILDRDARKGHPKKALSESKSEQSGTRAR